MSMGKLKSGNRRTVVMNSITVISYVCISLLNDWIKDIETREPFLFEVTHNEKQQTKRIKGIGRISNMYWFDS